jgi:hypothetical protein
LNLLDLSNLRKASEYRMVWVRLEAWQNRFASVTFGKCDDLLGLGPYQVEAALYQGMASAMPLGTRRAIGL